MIHKPDSVFLLSLAIALVAQLQQTSAFKVVNLESYATPSCSDREGLISFPYIAGQSCAPVAPSAAYFFDCDAGVASSFSSTDCSPESVLAHQYEIGCYEGQNGNKAGGYACLDMEASNLLLMSTGTGCEEDLSGVTTISGSRVYILNECTQYDTDKSFKVEVGEDNVVTSVDYRTAHCEGDTFGSPIYGPLNECFEFEGKSYYYTIAQEPEDADSSSSPTTSPNFSGSSNSPTTSPSTAMDSTNAPTTKSPSSPSTSHETAAAGLLTLVIVMLATTNTMIV